MNGPIECRRILGTWSLVAGGNEQVGPYLNGLWKQAIKKVPQPKSVRKILMLGLATGGTLPFFLKRFSNASITAVEIDPVMADLMKRLAPFKRRDRLEIVIGNAAEIVAQRQEKYDLVIFDLFVGQKVASIMRDEFFLRQALSRTQPHGYWLVNAFKEPDVLDRAKNVCGESARWRHYVSHVGLFRPWGSGIVGDPLPEGYQHFSTCNEYIERQFKGDKTYEHIYAGHTRGLRRHLGPVCFDHYVGDAEPTDRPSTKHRFMVFWQPVTRTSVPEESGWKRFPLPGGRALTGFAIIPPTGPYHEGWSEHAKRHRARWMKQMTHEIVEVDVETYLAAYRHCEKPNSVIDVFDHEIRKKAQRHPGMLRLRVARDKQSQEIIAGFASLWIPEIKQTFHVTSFITKAGMKTSAAFGLVDDVFRLSQERGCRFLEFDGFWTFGNPSSWKGFSRFKSQFDVHYLRWPHPFIRFD